MLCPVYDTCGRHELRVTAEQVATAHIMLMQLSLFAAT